MCFGSIGVHRRFPSRKESQAGSKFFELRCVVLREAEDQAYATCPALEEVALTIAGPGIAAGRVTRLNRPGKTARNPDLRGFEVFVGILRGIPDALDQNDGALAAGLFHEQDTIPAPTLRTFQRLLLAEKQS